MPLQPVTAITATILSLIASAALAQDTPCGAGLAPGAWIGARPDTSDIATAATAFDQAAQMPQGGSFVSLFTLSMPGFIRAEAAGRAGGDPVIALYDSAGTLVITDDDSGGGWDARAEMELAPGTYCLATRSYYGDALQADIRIGLTRHAALTPGSGGSNIAACTADTPAIPLGARAINQLVSITETYSANDAPYYRFTLDADTPLTIRATNPAADPYIYLYDSTGRLIDENDDYNSLNARIDVTQGLPPGNYCIGMRALSDPDLPIDLSVAVFSQTEMMHDLYASGEASPPADGSAYPVVNLGPLDTRLTRDGLVGAEAVWHAFAVPADGLAVIDAIGIDGSDPVIHLFDDLGRVVARNDDANGTLNSQITARVSPGTYLLGVTQYHGTNGVIRVAIQRYIPAQ